MYFEFDDVRRIHQPYTDSFQRLNYWKPQPYNSPYMNWQRGKAAMWTSLIVVEPIRHFVANVNVMS